MPGDLAGVGVDGDGGRGIEVIARAQPRVPRRGVAGAHEDQVDIGVVEGRLPRCRAAGLPQVARPGGVGGARDAVLDRLAVLVVGVAHVALDHRPHPHHLAGLGVARLDPAHDAELAARHTADDHALDDLRRRGHRIAGLVVVDLLAPYDLAGVLVERDELGVERAEDHQVAVDGRAAVDHVAAGHDAVGQAVLVLPQLLAGLGVERVDAAVRTGHEHLAVVDQRLRLLAALLLATERERPHRHQILHGVGVHLGERAVALPLGAQAVGDDLVCGFGILQDVLVGHADRERTACGPATRHGDGERAQHGGQVLPLLVLLHFRLLLVSLLPVVWWHGLRHLAGAGQEANCNRHATQPQPGSPVTAQAQHPRANRGRATRASIAPSVLRRCGVLLQPQRKPSVRNSATEQKCCASEQACSAHPARGRER